MDANNNHMNSNHGNGSYIPVTVDKLPSDAGGRYNGDVIPDNICHGLDLEALQPSLANIGLDYAFGSEDGFNPYRRFTSEGPRTRATTLMDNWFSREVDPWSPELRNPCPERSMEAPPGFPSRQRAQSLNTENRYDVVSKVCSPRVCDDSRWDVHSRVTTKAPVRALFGAEPCNSTSDNPGRTILSHFSTSRKERSNSAGISLSLAGVRDGTETPMARRVSNIEEVEEEIVNPYDDKSNSSPTGWRAVDGADMEGGTKSLSLVQEFANLPLSEKERLLGKNGKQISIESPCRPNPRNSSLVAQIEANALTPMMPSALLTPPLTVHKKSINESLPGRDLADTHLRRPHGTARRLVGQQPQHPTGMVHAFSWPASPANYLSQVVSPSLPSLPTSSLGVALDGFGGMTSNKDPIFVDMPSVRTTTVETAGHGDIQLRMKWRTIDL